MWATNGGCEIVTSSSNTLPIWHSSILFTYPMDRHLDEIRVERICTWVVCWDIRVKTPWWPCRLLLPSQFLAFLECLPPRPWVRTTHPLCCEDEHKIPLDDHDAKLCVLPSNGQRQFQMTWFCCVDCKRLCSCVSVRSCTMYRILQGCSGVWQRR